MRAIDWIILGSVLAGFAFLALYTRRFVRNVADYLAASRLAGRYLLTVSTGFGGAIAIISFWEVFYAAGLPTQWWDMMTVPIGLLLSLTGFIVYRFRQTRALTLAQFFEMRYSRRFRFFAGLLSWVSGMLNYGIFPAVNTSFMIYFLGVPPVLSIAGLAVSSFPLIMGSYLCFALVPVLAGGQISILVIDFFQGVLSLVSYVVLLAFLLHRFAWTDVMAGLSQAPAGKSMINPFDTADVHDFSIGFFLITVFARIYNARSWQGTSGFNSAARTPHEAKMAGILSTWRYFILQLCVLIFPLIAFAVLHSPKFSDLAAPILRDIAAIVDPNTREQMAVPVFLSRVLPAGLMGLFATLIVASTISCDNIYLHSWGTIFIQDVVLPLRRTPITQRAHLLLLRLSIVGVAIFGFVFSLWFPIKQYVIMYFAITGAIYLGGAGAVIIGGLYWKRGTTLAAWISMITGSVLAFGGLLVQQIWTSRLVPALTARFPHSAWLSANHQRFPVDGQVMYFLAMLAASLIYIVVSLLGPKHEHDMDRLLHRGRFAIAENRLDPAAAKHSWREIIGLDPVFNRRERLLFWATLWWSMGWWGVFLLGTALHGFFRFTAADWSGFWFFKIWFSVAICGALTVWITCGGVLDMIALLKDLRKTRADPSDDGRVDRP